MSPHGQAVARSNPRGNACTASSIVKASTTQGNLTLIGSEQEAPPGKPASAASCVGGELVPANKPWEEEGPTGGKDLNPEGGELG